MTNDERALLNLKELYTLLGFHFYLLPSVLLFTKQIVDFSHLSSRMPKYSVKTFLLLEIEHTELPPVPSHNTRFNIVWFLTPLVAMTITRTLDFFFPLLPNISNLRPG